MNETIPEDSGPQTEAQPVGFLDSLPEDLRSEPSLQNFTDAGGLAKSYVHAQRMIGADKLAIPGASATDDEWRAAMQKLGAPVEAGGYELEGIEFNEDEMSGFTEAAHAAGLTPRQAQAMAGYMQSSDQGLIEQFEQNAEQAAVDGLLDLRKEWGVAFDEKIEGAKRAAVALGLPYERHGTDANGDPIISVPMFDDIRLADGRSLGDLPEIIKIFDQLAGQLGEDTLEGATKTEVMTPDEARREASTLTAQGTPYWDSQHPEHGAYVQRVLELNEYIYPSTGTDG